MLLPFLWLFLFRGKKKILKKEMCLDKIMFIMLFIAVDNVLIALNGCERYCLNLKCYLLSLSNKRLCVVLDVS